MTELVSSVADKIDRAVQRVTPLAYRVRRTGRRWMRRALRKPRSVSEGPNLLPLLIQVLASFTKADGVILEEEIDSSLGFLRYDYPEAVYSELRQLFRQALYEQQDLAAMAQKLGAQLSTERKIMLGARETLGARRFLPNLFWPAHFGGRPGSQLPGAGPIFQRQEERFAPADFHPCK